MLPNILFIFGLKYISFVAVVTQSGLVCTAGPEIYCSATKTKKPQAALTSSLLIFFVEIYCNNIRSLVPEREWSTGMTCNSSSSKL
jgi:hypothetical protein